MMNERISDQVICSEDDVSYSAYDFWYERLSKLGKEEEIEFGVMYIGKMKTENHGGCLMTDLKSILQQ